MLASVMEMVVEALAENLSAPLLKIPINELTFTVYGVALLAAALKKLVLEKVAKAPVEDMAAV